MTEGLYNLQNSLDEDAHGMIAFSTENFQADQVVIFFITNVDTWHLKITMTDEKHLKCYNNTPLAKSHVAMWAAAIQYMQAPKPKKMHVISNWYCKHVNTMGIHYKNGRRSYPVNFYY